jgi:hypothetical protein
MQRYRLKKAQGPIKWFNLNLSRCPRFKFEEIELVGKAKHELRLG